MSDDINDITKEGVCVPKDSPVTDNPWRKLQTFTDARVGLGRAGVSVPTKHLLAFQLAHAQAIDAVHSKLNTKKLMTDLEELDWAPDCGEPNKALTLHSRAKDRATYLQRPDYGRLLNDESANTLDEHQNNGSPYDLAIVIVDGLSSLAIEQNAMPFLKALLPHLAPKSAHDQSPWRLAPICLVEQGRVAIGDDVCERLQANCVLILIGERPGLSSPDSLGLYLTWGGKVGLTDAYRNCISNIRPAGLAYEDAARKAFYLLHEARNLKLSGVKLKDRSDDDLIEGGNAPIKNFLIS
ncbi:ethanolamine ammonia-lyase subunit EutC [Marinomonas sp.]|nr:ethanolamine ammonia-lyase subunit EutC [Marinomonas sp.]MDB4837310.1 ethanolamine ammonia-lyase subunit EutC [Marinomonas sp.]